MIKDELEKLKDTARMVITKGEHKDGIELAQLALWAAGAIEGLLAGRATPRFPR